MIINKIQDENLRIGGQFIMEDDIERPQCKMNKLSLFLLLHVCEQML